MGVQILQKLVKWAIVNAVIILAVFGLWFVPRISTISNSAMHISWQQRQYQLLQAPAMPLEYNQYQGTMPLLNMEDVMHAIADISHIAVANNLTELNMEISEAVSFDTMAMDGISRIGIALENQGSYENITNFLHRLENIPGNIASATIVWTREYMATIHLEIYMYLA